MSNNSVIDYDFYKFFVDICLLDTELYISFASNLSKLELKALTYFLCGDFKTYFGTLKRIYSKFYRFFN